MIYIRFLLIVTILNLSLISCSNTSSISKLPPSELYNKAQQNLQMGKFRVAIKQLELLSNLYPAGTYYQQSQLDLIYAYYKNLNLLKSQSTIERFMRFNPTHPDIDYVIYMNGLTELALNRVVLQGFFYINANHSDRDLTHVQHAYEKFIKLVSDYPNSLYAADAQRRLIFIKEGLAKHELLIAEFYNKREAFISVINRVEEMIKNYPDTRSTFKALTLMENAYRKLQLQSEADKVSKIIAINSAYFH
ncbi:outer membrane protein assembly factor BamD [Pantoea sp. Mhis]|uniref:outer membrane protein assembly factor BamD n=1 Tax=Pantoea sp. Mhis TaxID=2576759 RepID=UPI001358EAB5|nr:outer membrane protein assembly factor BamD [Pantoea sp. Mhis]MXP56622.1 outer membrane protein assembly factor BamD [Pantoea sp. Mhis]